MTPRNLRRYSPHMYASGGSWGGCEDPRMVVIDGMVYVTFNMFDNWQLRVGYLTMGEDDFIAKRFYKWQGPYLLSHPARHKSWVIFPEKIHGSSPCSTASSAIHPTVSELNSQTICRNSPINLS